MTFEEGVHITGPGWMHGEEEPLETFSRTLERTAWDDLALDDRVAHEAALREAGISEQSVLDAVLARDEAAAEMAEAIERLKPYRGVAFAVSPPDYIKAQELYRTQRKSAQRKLRRLVEEEREGGWERAANSYHSAFRAWNSFGSGL